MITSVVRRAGKVLQVLVVCTAVAAVLLLAGSRVLGYHVLAVLSGSMTPTYAVGGAVFVEPVEPDAIARLGPGDVITYVTSPDGVPTTHRIVAVHDDGSFATKGDANRNVDPHPVVPEQVRGTVVFHIPLLGYVSAWLSDTVLAIRLIAALSLLYVATELVRGASRHPSATRVRRAAVTEELNTSANGRFREGVS